jgi:hypothetical protein
MDGVSIAASIVAVIHISREVFVACQTYYLAVKNARKDIQHLCNEITELVDILEKLAELATRPESAKLLLLTRLNSPEGALKQCMAELEELVAMLNKGRSRGSIRQFGLRVLEWPVSTRDVNKIVAAIGRHKETLSLALTTDQT